MVNNNEKRLRIIINCKPTLENKELIKWLDENTHHHFVLKKILINMMKLSKSKLGKDSNIIDLFNYLISSSLLTLEDHSQSPQKKREIKYLATTNVTDETKATALNQAQSKNDDDVTTNDDNSFNNDTVKNDDVNTNNEVNQPVDLNILAQNHHEIGVNDEENDVNKQQMFDDIKNLLGK